jgi:protein-S-isoprenylcysteine O-methyltransferase Ste14
MLIIKALIGSVFQVALFAAFLLIPAGTWEWPRAIQFLAVYWIAISLASIFLAIFRPDSLEARLEAPVSGTQPFADRVATVILIMVMAGWVAFIPIDVFYLHLIPPPSMGTSASGAVIGVIGLLIILATVYQNQFAVPVVRDQSDRGQVLVDTGLYGIIRHPMYSGTLVLFAGMGLWLESYASVIALIFTVAAFVPRILVEEKTLQETLPGYVEYMAKVRYRLILFVW